MVCCLLMGDYLRYWCTDERFLWVITPFGCLLMLIVRDCLIVVDSC